MLEIFYIAGGRLGLSSDIYIKENSPEVLSYDKYGKFFAQELGQLFADAGFQIGIYVLSGPFFGIPQTRTRAFFVAIKVEDPLLKMAYSQLMQSCRHRKAIRAGHHRS